MQRAFQGNSYDMFGEWGEVNMEKGFEIVSDAKFDTKGVDGNSGTDFDGDLANGEGIDLNSSSNLGKPEGSLEKTGIGTRIGALAQIPIAAFGGKDYDDGGFKPNAQFEAGELDNALRGPGYAEYADAPPSHDISLPEGYTSNINELMESENEINALAEAEQSEQWQQYSEALAQYEAENRTEQAESEEPVDDLNADTDGQDVDMLPSDDDINFSEDAEGIEEIDGIEQLEADASFDNAIDDVYSETNEPIESPPDSDESVDISEQEEMSVDETEDD